MEKIVKDLFNKNHLAIPLKRLMFNYWNDIEDKRVVPDSVDWKFLQVHRSRFANEYQNVYLKRICNG